MENSSCGEQGVGFKRKSLLHLLENSERSHPVVIGLCVWTLTIRVPSRHIGHHHMHYTFTQCTLLLPLYTTLKPIRQTIDSPYISLANTCDGLAPHIIECDQNSEVSGLNVKVWQSKLLPLH